MLVKSILFIYKRRIIKIILSILFIINSNSLLFSQGQCLSGGCTGGSRYPYSEFSTSSEEWDVVSTLIYAGEYAVYSIVAGQTYEWSLIDADGGSSSYDSQLTLLSEDGNTIYCFSDDVHNLNAKITWTASFTGKVKVLVTQYNCQTNNIFTTLVWRCASCGLIPPPSNDNCSGAIALNVYQSETCNNVTNGTVLGATNSGISSCTGTANNDVWYKFTASQSSYHNITVVSSFGFDAVVELFEGPNCVGQSIVCSDNSGSGGTEVISVTGLQSGSTYYVRVYDYFSSIPENKTFTICVNATSSCTPSYSSGTVYGDYINGVSLNGENSTSINNQNSGGGEQYVKDYTQHSVDLKPGTNYNLNLTNGEYGGQTLAAWIDFNNDGVYSNNEKIGEISNVDASQTTAFSFVVPHNATIGSTKMLIRSVWSQTDIDPCNIYSFGEAEVYTIKIISPCITPAKPENLSNGNITETTAKITWTAGHPNGSPTVTYHWAIGNSNNVSYENNYIQRGTTTSLSANINSLVAGTNYYWTVKAVTSCDLTSSEYANIENFTTTCTTPGTPISISTTNINTNSARLNWNAGSPIGSETVSYYWAVNTSNTVNYESNYVKRGITNNLYVDVNSLDLNTQYYWTVKAVTNCGSGFTSSYASIKDFTTLSFDAPITWNGSVSSDWATASNWTPNSVPIITTNVIIPSGCTYYPIIADGLSINNTNTTKRCKSLTINSGASVTLNGNYQYLYCSGLLTINGTLLHSYNATSTVRTIINNGGEVVVNNGGVLNIGNMSVAADRYNSLSIEEGGKLNIHGGTVSIMNSLIHKGEVNITSGTLYIKRYGSGNNPNQTDGVPSWDSYVTATLNVEDGDIYICGNQSGKRMIDWSIDMNNNWTGGTLHLELKQHNSGENHGALLRFSGHTINNLTINRNGLSNTIIDAVSNGVTIKGDLKIEKGNFGTTNRDIVVQGDFVNNSSSTAFIGGTATLSFVGSNKEIKGTYSNKFNNLTIGSNANYAVNNSITIDGDLNMQNESLLEISSGKTISVSKNTTINGDIISASANDNNADIILSGNYNISGNGTLDADISISNTRNLTSSLICKGDLIINSSSQFNCNSNTLNIWGDWINNGTFSRGSGSVVFYGENNIIAGSNMSEFNNLTMANGANYTLSPTSSDRAKIHGNLTINDDANLNIASSKVVDFYGSSIFINGTISAIASHNASIPATNEGRDFDINNNTTLSGNGKINADVRIFGNSTEVISDFVIDGNLIIRDAANLKMTDDKLFVSGNWSSPGNFICGNSTVIFNPLNDIVINTHSSQIAGTIAEKNNFWNISINPSEGKTVFLGRNGTGSEDQSTNSHLGHMKILNNFEIISGTFSTGEIGFAGRKIISNNVTKIHNNAKLHIEGLPTESNWGYYVPIFYGDLIINGQITTSRPINSGFAEIFLMGARLKGTGNIDEMACDVQIHTNAITKQESNLYIKGDLIIQNPGTFKCESNKTLTIGGDFYVYQNFIHKGTVNVHGNMTNGPYTTNTIDIDESIFNFIQSNSKYTILDKKIMFGEVNILGGGTRVFRQDIDCAANLTIANNTTMDMYDVSPKDISMSESSIFINNGIFKPYTNTVSFVGATLQGITGSSITKFNNLEINNSAQGVEVLQKIEVANNLILENGIFKTSSNNYINILDLAQVTPQGGKPNSYVNGPLYKTGRNSDHSYDFTFPIGKNEIWARAELENSSGTASTTDQFMAEYFDYPFPVVDFDESIKAVSNVEYWNITKISGNNNLKKRIKLYSEDKERSGIESFTDDDDLTVAHFNTVSQKWEDIGLLNSFEDEDFGWVVSDENGFFSPFTFGSKKGANPLPVELLSFNATNECPIVKIEWETVSEINNDYFIILRSYDLLNIEVIGIVKGTGNSNIYTKYHFFDKDIKAGTVYYSLKQVDFDGTATQYPWKSIYHPCISNETFVNSSFELISIYPNPTIGNVYMKIDSQNDDILMCEVYNLLSQKLLSQKINISEGENLIKLNIDSYKSNTYIFILRNNDTVKQFKIIKK